MKIPRLGKTILRYILSYASIALLSCILVGVVLFTMSVNELNSAHEATQYERLEIGANLVESNLELMQEVGYRLRSQYFFRTSYLKQNGYNPAIMLNYLSNFRSYVPLTSEFFLIYRDGDIVYKVNDDTAATNSFSLYMDVLLRTKKQSLMGISSDKSEDQAYIDSVYREINEANAFLILPLKDNLSVLFCYPIHFTDSKSDHAMLCFVVRADLIWEQVGATIGKTDTKYSVYYDNILIASQYSSTSNDLPAITSKSPNGRITFALQREDGKEYVGLNKYRILSYIFIASVAFLMFLAAIYAAWRNYQPLKELAQRYELAGGKADSNDALRQLSATLDHMFDRDRISAERLQNEIEKLNEQREAICHQLVQALICGQLDNYPQKYMQYLDVNIEEKLFGVLAVKPSKTEANAIPVSVEAIIPLLEGLTDDMQSIYGLELRNSGSAVFLCFIDKKEDMETIRELAEAVCGEQNIHINCGIGLVCDSYDRIPASFIDALSALENPSDITTIAGSTDHLINRLVTEVENANYDQAMLCLSEIFEQLPQKTSYLFRMSISLKVLGALIHVAHDCNVSIIEDKINMFAILQDQDNFITITGKLIARICEELSQKRNQQSIELRRQVIEYIRDHVSDYQMDLSYLAAQFGIPAKQISKLVRESTGLSYNEYLNSVRVELACKLLTEENLSVKETCARVGLSEVSYFIRIFKSITNETPLNYKKARS